MLAGGWIERAVRRCLKTALRTVLLFVTQSDIINIHKYATKYKE